LVLDVVKALFYACSSYPKIASPHRLSPSDDYEQCIFSALIPTITLYTTVNKIMEEFKYGNRGVKDLEIGRMIAKGTSLLLQDVGYRINIPVAISAIIIIYIDTCLSTVAKDFHDALRRVYNAMHSTPPNEVAEVVKSLRAVGGEFAKAIELAELSERRVAVEGIDLARLFSILSQYIKAFEPLTHHQRILEALLIAEKSFRNLNNINATLSATFIELAKNALPDNVDLSRARAPELLRLDLSFRKQGHDLSYLMPYIMFASLYIIKVLA
jgi:hypothetical protein